MQESLLKCIHSLIDWNQMPLEVNNLSDDKTVMKKFIKGKTLTMMKLHAGQGVVWGKAIISSCNSQIGTCSLPSVKELTARWRQHCWCYVKSCTIVIQRKYFDDEEKALSWGNSCNSQIGTCCLLALLPDSPKFPIALGFTTRAEVLPHQQLYKLDFWYLGKFWQWQIWSSIKCRVPTAFDISANFCTLGFLIFECYIWHWRQRSMAVQIHTCVCVTGEYLFLTWDAIANSQFCTVSRKF